MSILLDALKKSESQRQREQTPDIQDPAGGASAPGATRKKWIPVVLIAVSAAVMAWIGWRQLREPESLDTLAESPVTVVATGPEAAAAGEPEEQEASNRDTPAAVRPVARRTPVETLPPKAVTETKGNAEAPGSSEQADPLKARLNESFTAYEKEAKAAAAGEPAPAPAQPGESTAARVNSVPVARPGAASESAHVTQPISFWELPQGIRDGLPDLHITVLVYAEKAEDRFLLLGGRRLAEKDEVQDGVVLEEIRRDGAIFIYRNYRFLVEG